jgi:hypothetical protein
MFKQLFNKIDKLLISLEVISEKLSLIASKVGSIDFHMNLKNPPATKLIAIHIWDVKDESGYTHKIMAEEYYPVSDKAFFKTDGIIIATFESPKWVKKGNSK